MAGDAHKKSDWWGKKSGGEQLGIKDVEQVEDSGGDEEGEEEEESGEEGSNEKSRGGFTSPNNAPIRGTEPFSTVASGRWC